MTEEKCKHTVNAGRYATVADFKRIFTEDANSPYLLSLLLTGNPEKAEQCFVEGIGESWLDLADRTKRKQPQKQG